jgi:hypothetical protein
MPLRRHLPQLLEADAEFLRLATRIETEARDQRLGEAAAGAFGMPRVNESLGWPSRATPMSPVATPATAPLGSNSTSAAAKPG